jgi:hypothetical protein
MRLSAAFPGVDFNPEIFEENLSDIQDEYFLKAVTTFIQTTKEIYPGTGVIAILREIARDYLPKIEYKKSERTPEEIKKYNDFADEWRRRLPK